MATAEQNNQPTDAQLNEIYAQVKELQREAEEIRHTRRLAGLNLELNENEDTETR